MEGINVQTSNNTITFTIDENVYCRRAIFKAAYVFIDRFYIYIFNSDQGLAVNFRPKVATDFIELNNAVGDFFNELLHQMLRIQINEDTRNIRELILGRALYSSCIRHDGVTTSSEEYFKASSSEKKDGYEKDVYEIGKIWFDKGKV